MPAKEKNKDKKRKRKALLALGLLRKRLKKACGSFESVKAWQSFLTQYLDPVLSEYGDVIPDSFTKKLKKASHVDNATSAGINQACRTLQSTLATSGTVLGITGGIGIAVKTGVIAIAVMTGVAATFIYTQSTDIIIKNTGCSPVDAPGYTNILIPGVKLPSEIIYDGGQAIARLPGVTVNIESSSSDTIRVKMLGVGLDFTLPAGTEVLFNGENVAGQDRKIRLNDRESHTLELICYNITP